MQINIENKLGNRVEFVHTYPYCLLSFKASPVSYDLDTTLNIGIAGEQLNNSEVNRRTFKLEFSLCADSEEELFNLKSNYQRVVNNQLGEFKLEKTVGSRTFYINCTCLGGVTWKDITACAVEGTTTLVSLDPYWQEVNKSIKVPLITTYENFEFSETLEHIKQGGEELGVRGQEAYKVLTLDGDTKTGMDIEVIFGANVVNPSIINYTHGKTIAINGTYGTGEKLIINTRYGQKKCTHISATGVKTNKQFAPSSDMDFYLELGDNIMQWNATSGKDSMDIYINYSERYLEV